MTRWFRFYADAMRNPKVLRLSDKDFRLWVNLLALAAENDGRIPADDDLKLVLGMRLDHLKGGLDRLISGGLIDLLDDGYEPHHWSKFQYKSDTSTDRVQKHRAKRNVSETPPDTEADTETEKKEKSKGASALDYAFAGAVIRLKPADLERWQRSYSKLDLMAELQSRDDWLQTRPEAERKNWFHSTSAWLCKRNKEIESQPKVPL